MNRSGGEPPGDHAFSGQVFLGRGEFRFNHLAASLAHGVELVILVVVSQAARGKGIQQADPVGNANFLQGRENAIHRHRINVATGLQNPVSDRRYGEWLRTFIEGLKDKPARHGDAETSGFHAFEGL